MKSYFVTAVVFLLLSILLPTSGFSASENQLQKSIVLLEEKNYVQALEVLHGLERSALNPSEYSHLIAIAYLGRGYQLLSSGNLSDAGTIFQEGLRYNAEDIRLWQGEAMVRFKQGSYAEAAYLLNQAIGLAPQNTGLYHLLGKAHYADGRMQEAIDVLTAASQLDGGPEVDALLEKVIREWQVEQNMGQDVRGLFQLSFVDSKNAAELASLILDVLEEAYAELGSDLAYYPNVTVPVLLYLKSDFSAMTNSPDWAAGVYDGKIRLPLGGLHQMSDQLKAVLYHEYMHVIVHFMANRYAPVWLNEGLAELSGRRMYSSSSLSFMQAVQEKRTLDWESLSHSFITLESEKVPLAYEQSYSLVAFMVERYGWHKMTELLKKIGKKVDWKDAIEFVYQDYGLGWEEILKEWHNSLAR